jgi:hypothetical protein
LRAAAKGLFGLAVIGGVVSIGLLLGGRGNPGGDATVSPAPVEPAPPAAGESEHAPSSAQPPSPTPTALASNTAAPLSAGATNLITDWEERLDTILGAEGAPEAKARQLLEMFPRLPEAGQTEVSKHLCNLTADQDYAPMAQLLANPQLPPEVLDTLLADSLNRPNSLKLPALLEVARAPQHPKAAEAKEVLGFFLETDYGEDWQKWQDKVQEWLKENPD